ncbi:hypothetical protein ACFQX7_03670 [Luedemannella flava]
MPLLACGALALAGGLWSALLLLGVDVPVPRPTLPEVHGPLMVLGFVGTPWRSSARWRSAPAGRCSPPPARGWAR